MFTPSITGCISSFQFSKRGLLPFLLLPHAFLLLYICKFNRPVCIEAAGQKEFPLKKKALPGSALLNKKWLPCVTHVGPSVLKSFTYSGCTECISPIITGFFFTASHVIYRICRLSQGLIFLVTLMQVLHSH